MSTNNENNPLAWTGPVLGTERMFVPEKVSREVRCFLDSSKKRVLDWGICEFADKDDFPITVSTRKEKIKYRND